GSEMLDALEGFLAWLDGEPNARALLLYSTMRGGFCAGADLRELYEGLRSRPKQSHQTEIRAFLDRIHGVMNRLDMLPLPTIAMIHGVCFGGGFELALCCDLRVCEKTARFCFPELRLGIIPGFGGIPRLQREVGNAAVADLMFTGRSLNAKKAQELGLVQQVVARGEGLAVARRMAAQAAHYDRDATATCKRFFKKLPLESLDEEKDHFVRLVQNDAVLQALQRFVESTDVRPYL
ncbi:MAG: enoyl-CoA hydratase/isomerase family protein, partial [Myxococcales bacterium]|nr:enoyl-CoA hydratase/isomerase family protein [Myxococcales bacterium]